VVLDENGDLPKNACLTPAVMQFPKPIISKFGRRCGGIIFYIALAVYMFIGLAIVCDDYFVPALDRICDGECFDCV